METSDKLMHVMFLFMVLFRSAQGQAQKTPNSSKNPQLLQGLCKKTGHHALCLSSIAPFFNGNTDIIFLVEVMIKVGTEQTKQAMDAATKKALGSTVDGDAKTASSYKDCNENYDDALDNLQAALDAIPQNDIFTLETMISACISDYSTCDDGFTGQPDPNSVGVSPMAKTNENLMNICDIILAFAKMTP